MFGVLHQVISVFGDDDDEGIRRSTDLHYSTIIIIIIDLVFMFVCLCVWQ